MHDGRLTRDSKSKHGFRSVKTTRVFAMRRWLALGALFSVLGGGMRADEIGFVEDFALAGDRATALAQLIPGTEDYYYYHALHAQNLQQFAKVNELLAAWIKRYEYTPRVREIQYRQALLTYSADPQASLDFIRQQLGLEFHHQREQPGEKPNLPIALDPQLVSRENLAAQAFARHQNLQGFEDSALEWLAPGQLTPARRRHLLERLTRPDYPGLAHLVVEDLKQPNSGGFGSFPIHTRLLLSQLEECVTLDPRLLNHTELVSAYLLKLQPGADVDAVRDRQQRQAYLERLSAFVDRLDPVHNSLKAHVAYHRLVFDREQGVYDKARFLQYIRTPRQGSYINPEYLKLPRNAQTAADLSRDFQSLTLLPAVGDDEPLVRSYLQHFFETETTYQPYEPLISDSYLKTVFAETKIVHGLGEPEQWYSLLPPDVYQQLKERIDLDFAFTSRRHFSADEPVALDLDVKNVSTLLIKVHVINTASYYRQSGSEVNTDINLDGLVANFEFTHHYADPPLRRVRRHFDFPQLQDPGVYVIDFIGNGKSSRVVIRKGKLQHLVRTGTAGHVFTVLDEANRKIDDATLWLDGQEYKASADGLIRTPFSKQSGLRPIVLSRGAFSSLAHFEHQSESYDLVAGIFVNRESLLPRAKAEVVVRPTLSLNGVPITLSVLEETQLVITSVDHDGVPTTTEVKDFKLFEDRESVHPFRVPARLAQITFTLKARVKNLSQNQHIDLAATQTFTLNEIDKTEKTEDLHFARYGDQYVLEFLGKSGEPRPERAVQLSLKHRDFRDPVAVTLKTNAQGRIALGPLSEIASVTATGPQGPPRTWPLVADDHSHPQTWHARVGDVIQIPYMGAEPDVSPNAVSLLQVNGGSYSEDRFSHLVLRPGMLIAEGLPAGDYELRLKRSGPSILLRVAPGETRDGYVLGATRHLESSADRPLQLDRIQVADEDVTIRLLNATPHARLHVFATRFQPSFLPYQYLSRAIHREPLLVPRLRLDSLYAQGRNIGDEYRYILDRRLAPRFPGNMLERPGILLNPWAIRSTETGQQAVAGGDDFARTAENPAARDFGTLGSAEARTPGAELSSNLDFLPGPATVLLNLAPDAEGQITISRADLGSHQHLYVLAVDPRSTVFRSVALPEVPKVPRDLRLVHGLDPKERYALQKTVTIVPTGETFELADVASSRFESFDSVARVYQLYLTLSGDATLAEFGFVLNWPEFSPQQKREKYSKYACHELNLFLFHKDHEFFEQIIRPYLENKKDKTFVDRWLVGDDLSDAVSPWNFARLNIVERILLAQRVRGEQPYTSQHVREMYELIPLDVGRFGFLFNTALNGRALEGRTEAPMSAAMRRFQLEAEALGEPPASDGPAPTREPERLSMGGLPVNRSLARGRYKDKNKNGDLADDAFYRRDREELELRQLYQQLDRTQEWVENNYYHLANEQQNADLITANAFWNDYAEHDPQHPFLSRHLAEASRNFAEMMLALAVLDLPFKAGEHAATVQDTRMAWKAASPLIVFHEELRRVPSIAQNSPLLLSQNFFRQDDRYRDENHQRYDKFVKDEFLTGTVYGCQVIVTNPASSPVQVDLLLQIPRGALPVLNGRYAKSVPLALQPFSTQTVEYHFYFPSPGTFLHYPVHVARGEELLASVAPLEFHVVDQLSQVDTESWEYVSQHGTENQVLDYLKTHNLQRTNLDKIAWRMQDAGFFRAATELLARRHAYNHTLWSYAIRHNVPAAIREFLSHADAFVGVCGDYLDSPLLTIDPVARKTFEFREYKPLVNARAHRLGARRTVLNRRLHEQYHRLLKLLSYRRELNNDALLSVTYYLLLQDRIEEALTFFNRIQPGQLTTQVQYDYCTAYLSFFGDDPQRARELADKYADFPIESWRTAFAAIDNQLDELDGGSAEVVNADNRTQVNTRLASTEPSFELRVESRTARLNYQNLQAVQINYYLLDIELMFSTSPFVQQQGGQFTFVRPNHTQRIELPANQAVYELELPAELHNRNVLVEAVAMGHTRSQAYYANSLNAQLIENYGQVRVVHAADQKPLAKVYVKVYAQMRDGSIRFYKDGYTDLRGRFDYAALSTNELDSVEKFAILILSDDHGAVVREARPPKQ